MEDTLRGQERHHLEKYRHKVLILVLMEDTLRDYKHSYSSEFGRSLNPCFNGRYSQSKNVTVLKNIATVLILVLMEDTLRE